MQEVKILQDGLSKTKFNSEEMPNESYIPILKNTQNVDISRRNGNERMNAIYVWKCLNPEFPCGQNPEFVPNSLPKLPTVVQKELIGN